MQEFRRNRHDAVSETLDTLNDSAFDRVLGTGSAGTVGAGGVTSCTEVRGHPVVVKRLPLTSRDLEHPLRAMTDLLSRAEILHLDGHFSDIRADEHRPSLPTSRSRHPRFDLAAILGRHARTAATMNDFCWRMMDGDEQAVYPGVSSRNAAR